METVDELRGEGLNLEAEVFSLRRELGDRNAELKAQKAARKASQDHVRVKDREIKCLEEKVKERETLG